MSLQFNLLPWREYQRQKQLKRNKHILLLAVLMGFFLGGGYWGWQKLRLEDYRKALAIIGNINHHSVAQLTEKISLDELRKELHNQVQAIKGLQEERYTSLHLLENLSKVDDKDFYLLSFYLKDRQVRMEGIAENDRAVAQLIAALQRYSRYKNPQLVEIISRSNLGDEVKYFLIKSQVTASTPLDSHHNQQEGQ